MRLTLLLLLALPSAQLAVAQFGPMQAEQTPPPQAVAGGYTNLAFDDEFDSADTVSPDGTGNYNWYTTNFYNPSLSLPPYGYSIQNGYLTILTDASGYQDGLATADPSNTTQAWQHAYFEARISFCGDCSEGSGWPAFWTYPIEEATGQLPAGDPFGEVDFMEYYTQGQVSAYTTNVHQWTGSTNVKNTNNIPKIPRGTNFGQFHTYGCLWTPNQLQYYFDNKLVTTVATGPGTPFTALEQEHLLLILGTGVQWPMYVDYVRVWQ
jgi:beta-glucanase (GH16 family)